MDFDGVYYGGKAPEGVPAIPPMFRAPSDNRCTAEYDQHVHKRCTLPTGHEGRHHAQWEANMLFDHDYRDPHAADWLD